MDHRGTRATVFGSVAAAYAQHRPGYPAEAVGWALGGPAAHVVDLAAGTGKLTGALLARPGTAVTAVEPDPAMLGELRSRYPQARAVEGVAEAVPLPTGAPTRWSSARPGTGSTRRERSTRSPACSVRAGCSPCWATATTRTWSG